MEVILLEKCKQLLKYMQVQVLISQPYEKLPIKCF